MAIVCLSPSDIRPHLPKLVPALLGWSHEHRNHFKLNVRHIFERLIRKFGYEEIELLTGENDRKLLTNIRKRQIRAKRKREGRQDDRAEGEEDQTYKAKLERNAYEAALYGSEEEQDGSDEEVSLTKPAPGIGTRKQQQHAPSTQQQVPKRNAIGRRRGQQDGDGTSFIRELGEDPLDLLDETMLGRISKKDHASADARRAKRDIRAEGTADDQQGYRTDLQSGKLVFNQEDEVNGAGDMDRMPEDGDSMNAYLEAISGEDGFRRDAKGNVKFNKPTKRARAQLEEDELLEDVKDRLADLGVAKAGERPKKQKKTKESIGGEFKARRAGGDVKKAGGPNPYAYVPLGGNGKKRQGLNTVGKVRRK